MNDTLSLSIRKATEDWVRTFSHVPGTVIQKLADNDESVAVCDGDAFRLIASPRVECGFCSAPYEGDYTLADLVELHARGQSVACDGGDDNRGDDWRMALPKYAFPCGWGTLFVPNDGCDQWWMREHAAEVARLSFYVFESEDWGVILGIDAGGFDFFEAYWMPLYELRGLQQHKAA